jgi:hypothetical protein
MSKKRVVVDASDGITPEEISEAGRVLEAGVTPPEHGPEQFTVGEWKPGVPRWQCALCPFDTVISEAAMREHITRVHTPPPPPKPTPVALPIVDRFGNPVIVQH